MMHFAQEWGVAVALVALMAVLVLRHWLWSFRAQRPSDYAAGPGFDLRKRLNGPLICEGVIFGPTGRVVSRFTARMRGRWQGDAGILTEEFRYDSGRLQTREWQLCLGPDGRIEARAADVIGTGRGQAAGSALCLRYRIRLLPEAGGHVLDVADWMYATDGDVIVNRSEFRKFGFKVGELVATIRPAPLAV